MKFFKKSCLVAISIILCFTVLCQTATAAFWGNKTLYVKDLKIIYADSEKEAKEQLSKGYNLLPNNINDGTGELGVYICYSTTDDPDEAREYLDMGVDTILTNDYLALSNALGIK